MIIPYLPIPSFPWVTKIVPYLGYIEVDILFPQSFTGESEKVSTLALIVPDHRANAEVPVLIGTNALDTLYEGFEGVSKIPENCAYASLIRHLHSICKDKTKDNGKVGTVKLQCKRSIAIPACQKMALTGYSRNVPTVPGTPLMVEPPTYSNLPSGLAFCSYIISSPCRTSFKVPILLKNETTHNIMVPAHCALAGFSVPLFISPTGEPQMERSVSQQPTTKADCYGASQVSPASPIEFDFSDSPLPDQWKDRITKKLNSLPEVFARGDLDYGHTTAVKHKIRLSDPHPFKQRARPIHPSDYEAVRLHLKELYDANIIRESESPFASPIIVVKKKNG